MSPIHPRSLSLSLTLLKIQPDGHDSDMMLIPDNFSEEQIASIGLDPVLLYAV